MSHQRELLSAIVPELSAVIPGCGILLVGSVQWGCERPGSDIDLFVLVRNADERTVPGGKLVHEEKGMKLIERIVGGTTVHFVWWPVAALERVLKEEPYAYYPFSQGEILHDPNGLAARYRAMSAQYFEQKPEVERAWKRQLAKLRRRKADPKAKLEFPEWGDFAEHIAKDILQ